MFAIVINWVKYLKANGFGSQDPMFPRAKTDQGRNNLSFESATEVEAAYWSGTGRRSEGAGLPYFPPHTFRHLAINLAFKACKNGEEIKAISQNFGHEHIATTLCTYGNYPSFRLAEIISSMDFSGKQQPTVTDEIRELKEMLLAKKDKML
jgi:integrase/recombinase XerD